MLYKTIQLILLISSVIFVTSTVQLIDNTVEIVRITCASLKPQYWSFVGTLHTCITRNGTKVSTKKSSVVEKDRNSQIESLYFDDTSTIAFIPQNLKKSFPRLKMIVFDNQPIADLISDDLEQFGSDLEFFDVDRGHLTFLSANLFQHNSNLKYISFFGNPLKFIEPGFFNFIAQLQQLEVFNLESCGCIDMVKFGEDIKKSIWTHSCSDRSVLPLLKRSILLKNSK